MACSEKEHLLQGYFDGELGLIASLEIEEHLKSCPDCAQQLRAWQTLRGALQSPNVYDRAPQHLESRIRSLVPASPSKISPSKIARIRPATRLGAWQEALGIAAAFAIVVIAVIALLNTNRTQKSNDLIAQEVVESHVRSLQLGHLTDVVSSDQHTVKPWFNGKVDFAPPVTDFASQGFALVGGRLDYLDRHNAASLVYRRRAHLINVFIWPDETKTDQSPRTETIDGYHLIHWQQNGLKFWLISDVSPDDENQLVSLLRH